MKNLIIIILLFISQLSYGQSCEPQWFKNNGLWMSKYDMYGWTPMNSLYRNSTNSSAGIIIDGNTSIPFNTYHFEEVDINPDTTINYYIYNFHQPVKLSKFKIWLHDGNYQFLDINNHSYSLYPSAAKQIKLSFADSADANLNPIWKDSMFITCPKPYTDNGLGDNSNANNGFWVYSFSTPVNTQYIKVTFVSKYSTSDVNNPKYSPSYNESIIVNEIGFFGQPIITLTAKTTQLYTTDTVGGINVGKIIEDFPFTDYNANTVNPNTGHYSSNGGRLEFIKLDKEGVYNIVYVYKGICTRSGNYALLYENGDTACDSSNVVTITVSKPNSIESNNKKESFKIYPNPSSSNINVVFDDDKIHEISIFDINGKTIQLYSNVTNQISISNLKYGTYILRVSDKSGNTYYNKISIIQ